eukprot:COSAG02_NODE_5758_length_4062_cov_1.950038_1_plen_976_part_10
MRHRCCSAFAYQPNSEFVYAAYALADPCPPYSIGTLQANGCRYCPGGKVGPTDRAGVPVRGWSHSQEYACSACEAGKYRSETQQSDTCVLCPPGRYSPPGANECSMCDIDKITEVAVAGATRCLECPARQVANEAQTECVCQKGSFNQSFGLIFCFEQDYFPDRLHTEEYNTMRVEHEAAQQCLICPACVQCETGATPTVLSEYSLSAEGLSIWNDNLNKRSLIPGGADELQPRSIFRCDMDGKVCTSKNYDVPQFSAQNLQCAPGHEGSLCGSCADGWKGSFGEICTECQAGDGLVPAVALLVVALLVTFMYCRVHKKASEMQERIDGVRSKYALARKAVKQARSIQSDAQEVMDDFDEEGAFQSSLDTVKIVVGNLQIIAQLPVTLKFSCPSCEYFHKLISILPALNLDIFDAFSVDCLAEIGLYQRFVGMLMGPIVVVVLVRLWGMSSLGVEVEEEGAASKSTQVDRAAKADGIVLLIVFLVYPSVSTTIFSVFACRKLDFDQSFNVYDASIDCNSDGYLVLYLAALLALALIPIGVPLFFAWLLLKNRARLNTSGNTSICFQTFCTTARSLLKRHLTDEDLRLIYNEMDADDSGEVSSEELWKFVLDRALPSHTLSDSIGPNMDEVRVGELTQHSVKVHPWWFGGPKEFSFLVRAYEPQYYWWELTLYAKKFILSGLLIFAEPGSTTQLYIGLLISFYFFALLAKYTPYRNARTDRTAIVVEANLFFTLLCILMLKINLSGEWLETAFYDSALASSNAIVACVPLGIAFITGMHRLASQWVDSAGDPLTAGDRVRILECPDNLRACGHFGAVVPGNSDDVITVQVQLKHRAGVSWRTANLKMAAVSALADGAHSHAGVFTKATDTTLPAPNWRFSRCRAKVDTVQLNFCRDQLQLILSRKMFFDLCVAMCKYVLMCWRRPNDADEEQETLDEPKNLQAATCDIISRLELDDSIIDDGDEDISLKEAAIDALR